jgi:hypothetical protein
LRNEPERIFIISPKRLKNKGRGFRPSVVYRVKAKGEER